MAQAQVQVKGPFLISSKRDAMFAETVELQQYVPY